MASTSRTSPTIVITGTPGTGKSTTAQLLAEESPVPLQHINVGEWVKEKALHEGFDDDWQSYTVDEDKVYFFLINKPPFFIGANY
jgi:adenylate kinase